MERPWIFEVLSQQLVRHEGLCLKTYYCTAGKLTVGVGHNLDADPLPGLNRAGQEISRELALRILQEDVKKTESTMLSRWPWMRELDDARYAVMLNMAFNLGVRKLSQFSPTLALIKKGEYRAAAVRMLNSKWAEQVGKFPPDSEKARRNGRPGRAWELAEQMCTGKWQGV